MAIYWVSTIGDDADDGSTYELAKLTLGAGLGLLSAKGDILNIVNDGTYAWPLTGSETEVSAATGTSFSDFGVKIRGTDSSGVEAFTTIAASGGDSVRRLLRFRASAAYNIVENLIFDASGKAADANVFTAIRFRDNGQGPHKIRNCQMIGAGTGVAPASTRGLYTLDSTGSSIDQGEIEYCYIQYAPSAIKGGFGGALLGIGINNCVLYNDSGSSRGLAYLSQGAYSISSASNRVEFYDNTIYDNAGSDTIANIFSYAPAVDINAGTVNIYNNLIFLETTAGAPAVQSPIGGAVTSTGITHVGTIGYNVFVYGPSLEEADNAAAGTYQIPWDPDDDDTPVEALDIYATDTRVFETADTTVFEDPSSTLIWTLPNDLTITILKDLRPILYTSLGLGGTVPGALPAAATDLGVVVTASTLSPVVGETVLMAVTLSNSGLDATTVVVDFPVESGMTFVTSSVTSGTYVSGTGTWTVASILDDATATLKVWATVDAGEEGSAITPTATITSFATPSSDDNAANDADSVTLTVRAADPADPSNPATVPFLDVFPIYAVDLKLQSTIRLDTKRNRNRENYLRDDIESATWREMSSKEIVLAANTTTTVNLGGIESGEYLFVEATNAVQVSIGNSTNIFFPAATMVYVAKGDFTTVQLKNLSITEASTVLITAVD